MDPLGAEVGVFDPYLYTPNPTYGDVHGDAPMYVEGGDPLDLKAGCGTIDGMPATCSEIRDSLANGSAMPASLEAYQRRPGFRFQSEALGLFRYFVPGTSLEDEIRDNNGGNNTDEVVTVNTDVLEGTWHTFGVQFVSSSRKPQRTAVSPDERKAYRDRIAAMLEIAECGEFLNQLFQEAKKQTGRAYGGVLSTFDKIKFYWENTGGIYGGFASVENGVPIATISNRVNTEKIGGSLANQRDRRGHLISQTTQAFLAETLHHIGEDIYNDADMARALNTILVRQGQDTPKTFSHLTMEGVDNASRYWHPKVWDAYPAPRR